MNMEKILIDILDREKLVLSMIKLTKEKRIYQEWKVSWLRLAIHLLFNN